MPQPTSLILFSTQVFVGGNEAVQRGHLYDALGETTGVGDAELELRVPPVKPEDLDNDGFVAIIMPLGPSAFNSNKL